MNVHKLFNDSLERCRNEAAFMNRFYTNFLSASEEVREKFKNTDMQKQKSALLASIPYMTVANHNPTALAEIAKRHSKGNLNIAPHLYDIWLESMIQAVSQTDSQFNTETEIAWRQIMQPGIDYLIQRYHELD